MCVMLCVVYARKNNGGIDRRAEPTHNQSNENTTQPSNNDLLAEKTLQASMEGGSKNTATTKSSNESTVHRNVFSSDETLHPSTSIRFDSIRFDLIPRRIILDSTVYDFVIGIAYHRNRVEEGPAAGEGFPPCGEDQIPTFLFGMISSTRYGDGESTQFLSSLLRLAMILYRSHPTFFCFPDRISPEFEFKNLVLLTPSTFFFSFCGINPRTRRMIVTTNYNAHTLALCGSE